MGDAFQRAYVTDPLRPTRVFGPVFAIGAVAFLVAAVVAALSALGASPTVVARGTGGSVVLPAQDPGGELVVFGDATGSAPEPVRGPCTLTTSAPSNATDAFGTGELVVDGRTLTRIAMVTSGWHPGDQLRCVNSDALALTSGSGPLPRLGMAALWLFGAVVCTVLAAIGRASQRAREHPRR